MDKGKCFFIGVITGAIMMAFSLTFSGEPKAIEVYQGKTTLKYTIVDGVAKDSTVVYKGKEGD